MSTVLYRTIKLLYLERFHHNIRMFTLPLPTNDTILSFFGPPVWVPIERFTDVGGGGGRGDGGESYAMPVGTRRLWGVLGKLLHPNTLPNLVTENPSDTGSNHRSFGSGCFLHALGN